MNFRNAVQKKKVCSPTQSTFSLEKWENGYKRYSANANDDRLLRDHGIWMFNKLSELREVLKEYDLTTLSSDALTRCFVAHANREYYIITRYRAEIKEGERVTVDQLITRKIRPNNNSPNELNSGQVVEATIDSLRFLLLYAKQSEGCCESPEKAGLEDFPKLLKGRILLTNLYMTLDEVWRAILWNSWEVVPHANHDEIVSPSLNLELIRVASDHRRDRLTLETLRHLNSILRNRSDTRKIWRTRLRRIVINGSGKKRLFLTKPCLDNSDYDNIITFRMLAHEDYLIPFLDLNLPKIPLLTIDILLDCWQILAMLCTDMFARFPQDSGVKSFVQLRGYGLTLERPLLVGALAKCLGVERNVADSALQFLTFNHCCREQDLWAHPIVLVQSKVFPVFASILSPNMARMVERWAAFGGIDMAQKGTLYESHVRERLREETERFSNVFEVRVLDRPVTPQDDTGCNIGDIDLVLVFGSVVIIGEIKCFRQPTSQLETGSTYQIIEHGSYQAKAKTAVIQNNPKNFLRQIGWEDLAEKSENLKFIPLVVTNFPFYTGAEISGVNVVDITVLSCYFVKGGLESGSIINGINKTTNILPFYDSLAQASLNFEQYIKEPPQVNRILKSIKPTKQFFQKSSETDRPCVLSYMEVVPDLAIGSVYKEK